MLAGLLEGGWAEDLGRGLGGGRREQDSSAPEVRQREAGKGREAGQNVQEGILGSAQGLLWAGGDRVCLSTPTSRRPIISYNYLEKIN